MWGLRRWMAGVSRGGLAIVGLCVLVVAGMVTAVVLLRESADVHRRAQVMAQEVRASAQELSALKWRANTEVLAGTANLSSDGALYHDGARIIGDLTSEVATLMTLAPGAQTQQLHRDVQQVYISGLEQLALARGPKPLPPTTLTEMQRHFQPLLDRIDSDAGASAEHQQRVAASALTGSLVASIAALLLGVAALVGLGLRLASQRRRAELAEQKRAVERRSEQRVRALVEHSSDVVTVVGRDLRVRWQAASVQRLLGYKPGSLADTPVDLIVHPDDQPLFMAFLRARSSAGSPATLRARMLHADGHWRYVETIAENRFDDPAVEGLVLNMRDVSERKEFEDALRHQAFHDSLTGLANRALFEDRLNHALVGNSRPRRKLAVLFLDVDDFKTINDSLGHRAGDSLLKGVATRISSVIRPTDTAARLGGDEFAVLVDGMDTDDEGREIAERILDALRQSFLVDDRELSVTASIGIAFSDGSVPADELARSADVAMYAAKETGKNSARAFEPRMHDRVLTRLELRGELQRALIEHQFELDYQPIVSLQTGGIVGVEALVRWQHPARGRLAPEEFVALAEETGLIVSLGKWILERACQQAREWTQALERPRSLYVSVNVSIRQLREPDFSQVVAAALARTALEQQSLVLEITEGLLADDPGAIIRQLQTLKQLGLRIAIDDFGTGYSALSQLQHLPIDILKIDKSFIDQLHVDGQKASLVKGIINLGDSLKLDVIAEGIEQREQADCLRAMQSSLGQGFLFSRPLHPDAILDLLQRSPGPPTSAILTQASDSITVPLG